MQVLKIQDLQNLPEFSGRTSESSPPFFAVFGKPINHSLSPKMQNAALAEMAKTDSFYNGSKYFAFEVDPSDLKVAIESLYSKNFVGINLTIPHKEVIMGIIDDFDPHAKLIGACNTLLRAKNGWKGYNTDGFGLERAVEIGLGRKFENSDIVIIGAGGAARAAAFYVSAKNCKSLTLLNRSKERLINLANDIKDAGYNCNTYSIAEASDKIPQGSIIINATPIGLKETDSPVLDFSKISQDVAFFDMPYSNTHITSSVQSAKSFGINAIDGLGMLAWQGAKSLSIWTNKEMFGELMYRTLKDNA